MYCCQVKFAVCLHYWNEKENKKMDFLEDLFDFDDRKRRNCGEYPKKN